MSEHTPGPWMLGKDLPPERRELIRANEQAEDVFDDHHVYGQASENPAATWSTYFPVAEVEWPEDACLIAVAPELLAELENLEWVICASDLTIRECPSCLGVEETGHRNDCTLNAAISKARGTT